jgi:16S rRNA (uracil1498-N3)-methyltransferase
LHTPPRSVWLLNGPEGGLSASEDSRARAQGWQPITLGQRTLRAETAALAGLAAFSLCPPPL